MAEKAKTLKIGNVRFTQWEDSDVEIHVSLSNDITSGRISSWIVGYQDMQKLTDWFIKANEYTKLQYQEYL